MYNQYSTVISFVFVALALLSTKDARSSRDASKANA